MVYLKSSLVDTLVIFVLCLSVFSKHGAGENYTNVSEEENMEIEKQLKVLNKPPIKTIITKTGGVFDCIDVYKQPAFDNPLLKDHKIQMKPSYFIREENISKIDASVRKASSIKINELHKEIMCPAGTVPIRRTTKRELIFSNLLKRSKRNQTDGYPHNHMYHHYVTVETPYDEKNEYYGAKSSFGIHKPSVTSNQFSTSQMWIQNGPRDQTNSIEIGWAVFPELFGDDATRTFGYWTADGYKNTGCFNMLCPGFVQVHTRIPFGTNLNNPVPGIGNEVFFWVFRDKKSHNWWYYMGNDDSTPIGYWPQELFPHLPYGALVKFGGIADAMLNAPSPPMGNGNLPTDAYIMEQTGFMRYLQILEENGGTSYFGNSAVPKKDLDTRSDCYDVVFRKYGAWRRRKLGYNSMIFGGPGGYCI
ncbi:hypothetical protein C5167_000617 [Papaver somniferum]|uniref:Neprosin PEP catalytic domain-containing protein n=1 Tax=Papaver somniferum TaxID=3469 RepID=A0A4Y7KWL6_PAPSO|nr:uncharacterized protein LOC113308915 isoform X1 [Papaver somniferum]RZC76501.1 hypothetical protein C5167_000617 [Papaver somniferum]